MSGQSGKGSGGTGIDRPEITGKWSEEFSKLSTYPDKQDGTPAKKRQMAVVELIKKDLFPVTSYRYVSGKVLLRGISCSCLSAVEGGEPPEPCRQIVYEHKLCGNS